MSAVVVLLEDWELFQDWCAAVGKPALPAAPETVTEFLRAVPGRASTDHRRLQAIRRAHQHARAELPIDMPERASTLRSGSGWVSVTRALAQLPTLRFPVGFRGRRDGWLLVLLGELGLSRREALSVTEADVHLYPELHIAGRPVSRSAAAEECPACAVYRWLRVVGPAESGRRQEVRVMLDPNGVDDTTHDCGVGLDGSWREADVLAPAIDRYGFVSGVALSRESVSDIMRTRQRVTGEPLRGSTRALSSGRFKDATSAELAAAYDEVDQRLAELLARVGAAVDEGADVLGRIEGHTAGDG